MMEVTPQHVWLLVLDNGSCPIEEWLVNDIRDDVTRARISRRIDKLQRGLLGDWKGVRDAVQELRLDFGPGYRVYFARSGRQAVVIVGGGDKGSQKADIRRAQALWDKFLQAGAPEDRLRIWKREEEDGGNEAQELR